MIKVEYARRVMEKMKDKREARRGRLEVDSPPPSCVDNITTLCLGHDHLHSATAIAAASNGLGSQSNTHSFDYRPLFRSPLGWLVIRIGLGIMLAIIVDP
jgi:hypothetical protein